MDEIFVKVIRIPGAVTEVALSAGASVADALSAASIEPTGSEAIKVGAETVEQGYTLTDGDRVVISQGAKGN
jgi:hypothetical protein